MKSLQFLDLSTIGKAFRHEATAAKAAADRRGLTAAGTDKHGRITFEPSEVDTPDVDVEEHTAHLPKTA